MSVRYYRLYTQTMAPTTTHWLLLKNTHTIFEVQINDIEFYNFNREKEGTREREKQWRRSMTRQNFIHFSHFASSVQWNAERRFNF